MKHKSYNDLTEDLFVSLSIPLNRFVFNILKNAQDAEDIVADTFVRIMEIIYVKGEIPSRPLCYAIARNLAIDFLRRKKKINYNSDTAELMEVTDDTDVFEEVNNRLFEKKAAKLISKLPEAYANVFCMRFYDDLSFKEIGDIMGIDPSNARVMYHRAKNKLKKIITDYNGGNQNG